MAEERFTITYDGPALQAGRMDVRDLAPALVSMADAIQSVYDLGERSRPAPSLEITAFSRGSFVVQMLLTDTPTREHVLDILSGKEATAGANLLAYIGATFGGFKLVQHLRGRRIRAHEPDPVRAGWVKISFDDGVSISVPARSYDLASDLHFRQAARQVVQPVTQDGIDVLRLERADDEPVVIRKEQAPAFEVPDAVELLITDSQREVALRLVNIAFVEGHKWRFSDGDNLFYATIEDTDFLDRVQKNVEAFSSGDLLRVNLRTRQWQNPTGDVRNEHVVLSVIDHIRGPRTVPLPFAADGEISDPAE